MNWRLPSDFSWAGFGVSHFCFIWLRRKFEMNIDLELNAQNCEFCFRLSNSCSLLKHTLIQVFFALYRFSSAKINLRRVLVP